MLQEHLEKFLSNVASSLVELASETLFVINSVSKVWNLSRGERVSELGSHWLSFEQMFSVQCSGVSKSTASIICVISAWERLFSSLHLWALAV